MNRSIVALGLLSAFSALAGSASAQSSVNIYGILDAGVVAEPDGPAGDTYRLSSGIQSGSRLGFKGTEDLGGGLSAKFVLESGFNIDDGTMGQGGLLFGRQAYAGLAGGWGEVDLGRQYSPHYLALVELDPFGLGLAGAASNLIATPGRVNNTIKYSAPNWGGFTGELAYSLGEVAGDTTASSQYGLSIGYVNGPILAKLAYHHAENPTATDQVKTAILGGRYDFGVAAATAAVNWSDGLGAAESRDYMLGLSAPFGAGTFLASYIRKDDRSGANADAKQWAVGYTHALSKRTNLYTSYGSISNDGPAAFTVGNASSAGTSDSQFNVGIRHKF